MSGRELEGKCAIVTGAGRGIGRAIALAYAGAGAQVCCAARTLSEVQETASEIERKAGRAIAVAADVTQQDQVDAMIRSTVQHFGGLDLLVINAGQAGERRAVEHSDPEDWRDLLEVNLVGAYRCARSAVPHLRARGGGKILAIGSGLGHRGLPETSAYACSKAGLWMLVRVLAQELAQDGITVNELVPGPVATAMSDGAVRRAFSTEWLKQPEDVAPLALFLAGLPDGGPTAQSFSLMRRDG